MNNLQIRPKSNNTPTQAFANEFSIDYANSNSLDVTSPQNPVNFNKTHLFGITAISYDASPQKFNETQQTTLITDDPIELMLECSGLSSLAKAKIARFRNKSIPLNEESLESFLNFWEKVSSHSIEPELFLCPNGNLKAEWFKNYKKNLNIEFTKDNTAYLNLYDAKNVIEAIDNINEIARNLINRPTKPFNWN